MRLFASRQNIVLQFLMNRYISFAFIKIQVVKRQCVVADPSRRATVSNPHGLIQTPVRSGISVKSGPEAATGAGFVDSHWRQDECFGRREQGLEITGSWIVLERAENRARKATHSVEPRDDAKCATNTPSCIFRSARRAGAISCQRLLTCPPRVGNYSRQFPSLGSLRSFRAFLAAELTQSFTNFRRPVD